MPVQSIMIAQSIAAAPPPAGPALRNSAKSTNGSGNANPTVTLPATLGGSCIVVQINDGSASNVSSVMDNIGNTYAVGQAKLSAGGENLYIYYCQNAGAGVTTITVNFSGTGDASVFAGEITGVLTSGALDTSGSNGQQGLVGSPPYTFNSNTLAQASNFAWLAFQSASASGTYTEGTGATIMQQETNSAVFWTGVCAYKVTAATTAVTSQWNGVSLSNPSASILIFKGL